MRIPFGRRPALVLAVLIAVAIFVVDLATPVGVADWLGYLLPLLVASRVADRRELVVFVACCSVLVVLGFLLSPTGIAPMIDIVNRALAIGTLWLTAILLTQRQHAEEHLSKANDELRVLSRRLVEAQEEERRALARELHDEAGQALTALKIGLGLLEKDAECAPGIAGKLEKLKSTTDGIMQELHRLAVNLRPSSLDRLGLAAALRQYVEQYNCEQQVTVRFEVSQMEGVRLSSEVETALYRIAQESLTNVARYAGASNVGVILTRDDQHVTLMIEDDGVGFDLDEALQRGRLGLVGMVERTRMLGGSLEIETAPGAGTTVFARVPFEPGTEAQR